MKKMGIVILLLSLNGISYTMDEPKPANSPKIVSTIIKMTIRLIDVTEYRFGLEKRIRELEQQGKEANQKEIFELKQELLALKAKSVTFTQEKMPKILSENSLHSEDDTKKTLADVLASVEETWPAEKYSLDLDQNKEN